MIFNTEVRLRAADHRRRQPPLPPLLCLVDAENADAAEDFALARAMGMVDEESVFGHGTHVVGVVAWPATIFTAVGERQG